MGLESGAQAAYDIGRQGGTFAQQLQGGVASGVLAALIQKMPLAMVRKAWQIQGASGVQRFVKAFVKGALPESGVGFANTVAWNVADRVALGKEADMGKAEFWLDSLKQAFYASAVGAISGGLIAGVPAGFRGLGTRVAAGTGGLEGELSTANGTNSIGKGAGSKLKVVDGKVGGKVPVDDYNAIQTSSVKNPSSNSLTLGKYADDATSYTKKAGNTSYFDMGDDWGNIQNQYKLSDAEMFDYFNKPVLDKALSSGQTIRFSHNPLRDAGALGMEWDYIKSVTGLRILT